MDLCARKWDHFQVHPEFGDFRGVRALGGSIAAD